MKQEKTKTKSVNKKSVSEKTKSKKAQVKKKKTSKKSQSKKKRQGKANKMGRPVKFKSVKEVEKKIQEYFDSCQSPALTLDGRKMKDKKGRIVYKFHRPLTISGLAVALGTNRTTLLDYQHKDEFSDTIERAKAIIENWQAEALFSKESVRGSKFSLINNFNKWSEKKDVNVTGKSVVIQDDIPVK